MLFLSGQKMSICPDCGKELVYDDSFGYDICKNNSCSVLNSIMRDFVGHDIGDVIDLHLNCLADLMEETNKNLVRKKIGDNYITVELS